VVFGPNSAIGQKKIKKSGFLAIKCLITGKKSVVLFLNLSKEFFGTYSIRYL